ncbi:MAG: Hsp20 family protein, partial [Bdellovibrionota bacterium]
YDNEIKRVHSNGETEVRTQKDKFQAQIMAQDEYFKKELEQDQAVHQQKIVERQKAHLGKLQEQDKIFKDMALQQNQEFEKQYLRNDKAARGTLDAQEVRLTDALVKQKEKLVQRFDKYSDKGEDPFYNMKDFETKLNEEENFFVVKTKIPEHERKNVDVVVKEDKVVVTGQRKFSEKVKRDDRELATDAYQSFREIIPLRIPVVTKGVMKEYKDGHLTVTIPKLFFNNKTRNFLKYELQATL